MPSYSLSHLSDQSLERELASIDGRHRSTLAALLSHLSEFDERRLYLPAAFSSMHDYCVRHLHWCEQAALKRVRAARYARRFPAIFTAVADGRLHLTAVLLLGPNLTRENSGELLAAVAHKTRAEIERILAQWFPRTDVPTLVQALAPSPGVSDAPEVSPGTPRTSAEPGSGPAEPARPPVRVAALAPQRYALQLTVSQETHDKLRHAQELLGHQVRSKDLVEVLDRALDALIRQLEKSKFAASDRPQRPRKAKATTSARHIPAHVKRAVWERDGGRCTFLSDAGQRCPGRDSLEYDHLDPVARGGAASITNLRLRCRGHNQLEAERTFGIGFMHGKRENAREVRGRHKAASAHVVASVLPPSRPETPPHVEEVIPCLRVLGYKAGEARAAAALCEAMPGAPIEDRVRRALRYFPLRGTTVRSVGAASAMRAS